MFTGIFNFYFLENQYGNIFQYYFEYNDQIMRSLITIP
jgi:hypothetical protein